MHLIGDTHTLGTLFKIIDSNNLRDSNLIHVGDFGLGFVSIAQDLKNLELIDEMLMETNNRLYVIRGNHDNPIFWDKSKGLNLPKLHNLVLVEDYSVFKIEDKNVLFVGGAISIDRQPRKEDFPYPSWWEDETFKYDPLKLDKAIVKAGNIDIVVTHTAPSFCKPRKGSKSSIVDHYAVIEKAHGNNLCEELDKERLNVDELYNDLITHYKKTPSHWFYGHFHSSWKEKISKINFVLLGINEVYEVK